MAQSVLRGGPGLWADAARAAWELARARRRLGRHSGPELIRQGRLPPPEHPRPELDALALAERVAFAIPRVAARVPWRADCWVQAMAAQSWLVRERVATDIFIGVRQDEGEFKAHAWLILGGRTVTGGDVSGYVPLVTPSTPIP